MNGGTMSTVGQIEKQTQARIVALLRVRLHSTGHIQLVKLCRCHPELITDNSLD